MELRYQAQQDLRDALGKGRKPNSSSTTKTPAVELLKIGKAPELSKEALSQDPT